MPAALSNLPPVQSLAQSSSSAPHSLLSYMENVDKNARKKLPCDIQDPDASALSLQHSLEMLPSISPAVINTVDDLCTLVGHKPASFRLLEINAKMMELFEKIIWKKENEEYTWQKEIGANVDKQQSKRNQQALSKGISGFGGSILLFAAAALGDSPVSGILKGLAQLIPHGADAVERSLDASMVKLSHDQSFFLSTAQGEKQGKQGLTQALQQLRQLILELIRLETQSAQGIMQR